MLLKQIDGYEKIEILFGMVYVGAIPVQVSDLSSFQAQLSAF